MVDGHFLYLNTKIYFFILRRKLNDKHKKHFLGEFEFCLKASTN